MYLRGHGLAAHGNGGATHVAEVLTQFITAQAGEFPAKIDGHVSWAIVLLFLLSISVPNRHRTDLLPAKRYLPGQL